MFKPKFHKIRNTLRKLMSLPILFLTTNAFASDDTVTTVIYNLCDWLSGAPAIGVGILAVIYSGYEMLHGEVNKKPMIIRCVAIALIIGGSYIGKSIIMKGIA